MQRGASAKQTCHFCYACLARLHAPKSKFPRSRDLHILKSAGSWYGYTDVTEAAEPDGGVLASAAGRLAGHAGAHAGFFMQVKHAGAALHHEPAPDCRWAARLRSRGTNMSLLPCTISNGTACCWSRSRCATSGSRGRNAPTCTQPEAAVGN